jgi:hypothetical protein
MDSVGWENARRVPKSIDVPEHEGDKQFIAYAPRYKAIGGRKMAVQRPTCTALDRESEPNTTATGF